MANGRARRGRLGALACALGGIAVLLAAVLVGVWFWLPRSTASPPSIVHVDGTRLVTGDGASVQLLGVSRSGSEFACLGGHQVFQGPVDDASIAAIASWQVKIVRIPLNEDCWLGINGIKPAVGGVAYQNAVATLVGRLEAHGMLVDLDLHWSAPAAQLASSQQVMPDADHSATFWQQLATRYRGDPHVLFELYNEPHDVSWTCWRDGCLVPGAHGHAAWRAMGMQQLVDVVRATGARNVILVGGLGHAGDLSHWAQMAPHDPMHQIAASWHVYPTSACQGPGCWSAAVAAVGGSPVLVTEFGELDCQDSFVGPLMDWLDRAGIGYIAWAWNVWAGCGGPSLLRSYEGQPGSAYGEAVLAQLTRRGSQSRS